MDRFRINQIANSSVLNIYTEQEEIHVKPEYQRNSNIWSIENRQLLVDSVINGFDLPKLYFHEFSPMKEIDGRLCKYAIVDGKQRLTSLWQFIDGKFPLANDFRYLNDDSVEAGGMTYSDLGKEYPKLKLKFDAYTLTIISIQTAEIELIEDMFYRLNEAERLNAAEKRNAYGGIIPGKVRSIADHPFFKDRIKIKNDRYRHYDLVTKFLYFEFRDNIVSVKKKALDIFVDGFSRKADKPVDNPEQVADELEKKVVAVLDKMNSVFTDNDNLLRSVGMVTIYYLFFRQGANAKRSDFEKFRTLRNENRSKAEEKMEEADFDLIEFDRLTQSPNDAAALKFRLGVLNKFIGFEP